MTIPLNEPLRPGVDRRRRLIAALHGRAIERAYRDDKAIRADLEAEARDAENDVDALMTPEMLDHLRELIAKRATVESILTGTPTEDRSGDRAERRRAELFFSTDIALIVPGFLASTLKDRGDAGLGLIWLDPALYFKDRIDALKLGGYDGAETDFDPNVRIEATGVLPILYDFLRLTLEARRYTTEIFAVDWRKDIEIAATRLEARLRLLGNDARPVHLIAHSQGALVARRALQRLGAREAKRIVKNLVLLGPANYGSFSAAFGLLGDCQMIRLARRLAVEPIDGFQKVLATFTGIYQLLPFDADRVPWLRSHNLGDPAFWNDTADEKRLRLFHGWAGSIDTSFFDDRTTVILGDRVETTGGLTRVDGVWVDSAADSLPGDGTIPHSCSVLAGARSYLASDVEHSLMAARRSVVDAVVNVLGGRSPKLSEVSSDYRDHLGSGSFTRAVVVHPTPARELKIPPPRRSLSQSLNGKFLIDYDDARALPERPASAELFRRDQLRGEFGGETLDEIDLSSPTSSARETVTLQSIPASFGRPIVASLGADSRGSCFELILDASNLLPFDFLRTGDRLGRAVVKIERGDGAAGTGFLVAPDILLTNNHVLPDAETAASAVALANFETSPTSDRLGRTATVPLDPQTLFVTNADLDFTFCAVVGLEYLGAVPLTRNSLNVLRSEYINIIQHPRGRPKEVVVQDNQVVRADNVVLQYSCDTEPGSSGSPVFNNQWKLVALHHASVRTDSLEGRRSRDGDSRTRYLNEGVRLSAIATWLETTEANHPEQRRAVERLRAVFDGLDPQIGFFGALGRRSRGRSAAEVVVESYRGGCDDLDVAYWNLDGFALDEPANLAEFARVVAEMNMDVWCLENVSPAEALTVRQCLEAVFRLDYAITGSRKTVGLTILQRRREGLSVLGRGDLVICATTARGCSFEFGLETLRRSARLDSDESCAPSTGLGRLIVGSATDWAGIDPATIVSGSLEPCLEPLIFGSTTDGAIAVVPDLRAAIDQVFVSSNLSLWRGGEDRVCFTRDRDFPERLRLQGRTLPVAIRLSLPCSSHNPGDLDAIPCADHCRHPAIRTPAPIAISPNPVTPPLAVAVPPASLDEEFLERKLRAMLIPLLSQILGDLRPGDSAGRST